MSSPSETSVHRALGLTDDEFAHIGELLGRNPNHLELAMYSVMWSEHCSYKSSRRHLGRLPTEAPWVLVGPGENAGVVDVGDGIAAAIRIESHNHPSAIEPYQGAATGVGGILRDIFTMGARPIAVMDPLRFGPLDDPRSRWIAEGVVSGVSGYGNAVGVPTVGGEVVFDETYRGNPLVNVLCLGILPTERLVLGQASGKGNLAVLLGSATGRDGIGGVSVLASAGFDDDADDSDKRPSVQVGDPFEEKRLLEACLALLDEGLVTGIQDLGGAGLVCATSETASRGGAGMDVDILAVPRREADMEPFELMISESQERMLAIVEPASLEQVMAICERWEVRAAVVGKVTDGGALRIREGFDGPILADIPAKTLHDDAPNYDRPRQRPADADERAANDPRELDAGDVNQAVLDLMTDLSWVYRQYDHQLFLNTVVGPGHDGTLLRLRDPRTGEETGRGLGLSTDGNHRWCSIDPRVGTAMLVAEAAMNVACVGARPLAVVNCLNFGNPEFPEVMWQLSEAVDGMSEACLALDAPVVGGNVSLYNQSNGTNIDPTPVVGLLGMHEDLSVRPPGLTPDVGDQLLLLGLQPAADVPLGGSRWAWDVRGRRDGRLPTLDLDAVVAVRSLTQQLVTGGSLSGVHDVGDGGLAVALGEFVAVSGYGLVASGVPDHQRLFCESPGRVLVTVSDAGVGVVTAAAEAAGVPVQRLGSIGGDRYIVDDLVDLAAVDLRSSWADRLPNALGQGTVSG
jgi:phosphoribosylformylglycinamidine synthase II